MMPEGFVMFNEIFSLLMDRFEVSMMKKRVDNEYKMFSVQNAISTCMHAINISEMQKDDGDEFGEYAFEPYHYEEESEEPVAAKVDNYGVEGKMGDPFALSDRFRVSQFKKLHQAGINPHRKSSPSRGILRHGAISIGRSPS